MKDLVNYVICSALLFVAVVLVCGGGVWSLVGLAWCGLLVASGDAFPAFWRRFWRSNMRILRYFDSL